LNIDKKFVGLRLKGLKIREKYTSSFMANVTNVCNHTQFLPGSHNMKLD